MGPPRGHMQILPQHKQTLVQRRLSLETQRMHVQNDGWFCERGAGCHQQAQAQQWEERADSGQQVDRLCSRMGKELANTCEFEHRPHNQWPSHAGAENLAGSCEWYPQGITPVFDNWKNSPGHNVNMLGDHKVMGVGLGQKKGCEKFCWTSGNQADQEGSVIVAMYG